MRLGKTEPEPVDPDPLWRRGDLCWVQIGSLIGPPVVRPARVMDAKLDTCLLEVTMNRGQTDVRVYAVTHLWRRFPEDPHFPQSQDES